MLVRGARSPVDRAARVVRVVGEPHRIRVTVCFPRHGRARLGSDPVREGRAARLRRAGRLYAGALPAR
ncbi:hypothetical protein, partial [Streptomyces sp. SID9913]|uniref:hypothetical protein n=1 Tax=Streptomyces sp. SID9913 TaxID=2706117 RepID=UPI0019408830